MSIEYTDISALSHEDMKNELKESGKINFTIPYTSRDTDVFFSSVLKSLLEILEQEPLHSHLEYAVNELTTNASKANSKRLYFLNKGLDITDAGHYAEGMKTFKSDVFQDFSHFENVHKENNAFVDICFQINDSSFGFEVRSGTPFLPREMERIRERLEIARKFDNLTEVLTYGFDDSEGAGFGLIIILLMLRKVNLDEKALVFRNEGEGSFTSLSIPTNLLSVDQGALIAGVISEELKQMPQFPANIQTLQRELSDPNCTFASIADTVNSDPTLSAEILRIANSPVYRVRNEITDVAGAVRIIGMLGVKSVLYNYGMTKVMKKRYNAALVDEISQHSFMVALLGSFIARFKKIGKIAEDVYTAALLHDMGKIIVTALNPELEDKLEALCKEKHIPISILDDLTEGFNHALIGSEVAKKWDFPAKLVQPIKFHHIPLEAGEEFRAVTYCVYLANEIYHYEQGNRDFNDLNYMVLSFFGLEHIDSFMEFLEEMKVEGLLM